MTPPIFKDREYLNATAGLNNRPHTNAIRNQFDYKSFVFCHNTPILFDTIFKKYHHGRFSIAEVKCLGFNTKYKIGSDTGKQEQTT